MTIRSHTRGGILGGPVDGPERLAKHFPPCEATPGLPIAHRSSGFTGRLVALEGHDVVVAGQTGLEKRFKNAPGSFSVGGQAVHLVPPALRATDNGRVSATGRTASGSRAVIGAKARVAQPSRILEIGRAHV